jgi:hypothetical protein
VAGQKGVNSDVQVTRAWRTRNVSKNQEFIKEALEKSCFSAFSALSAFNRQKDEVSALEAGEET